MFIFLGLGNPGETYAPTRHNIGFMALDLFASDHDFSPFRLKFSSLIAEGFLGSHKVLLCKPQTFMNLSGRAARDLLNFYKVPLSHLYVFHDDLDLELGRIKVKQGGGNGGHNGLASLDSILGKEYWRIRLGIGHPGHKDRVSSYVLSKFHKNEQEDVFLMLNTLSSFVPTLADADKPTWLSKFPGVQKAQ